MGVSYARFFSNLRELTTNSDVIVLGKVVDAKTIRRQDIVEFKTNTLSIEFIKTTYKFKIEQVIKGDVSVGEIIAVNQTGGIVNGKYTVGLINGKPAVMEDVGEGPPSKLLNALYSF
ncbi:MAG: hypothetical protein ACP5KW_00835 [Thermoproteota archaeon]